MLSMTKMWNVFFAILLVIKHLVLLRHLRVKTCFPCQKRWRIGNALFLERGYWTKRKVSCSNFIKTLWLKLSSLLSLNPFISVNNPGKMQAFYIHASIISFCSANRHNETSFVNTQYFGCCHSKSANFVKNWESRIKLYKKAR